MVCLLYIIACLRIGGKPLLHVLKRGMGALVKGNACLYVSSRLERNVNRNSQEGMWHHAVFSNRFWILLQEGTHRKVLGTSDTLD